jgi:alpha-L-rhamnosidase
MKMLFLTAAIEKLLWKVVWLRFPCSPQTPRTTNNNQGHRRMSTNNYPVKSSIDCSPIRLRTQFRENPIGIGERKPILQWNLCDNEVDSIPNSWQILVADSPESLILNVANRWDSGWIESPQLNEAVYAGLEGISRERLWWKVRVQDSQGVLGPWSDMAYWEYGLLDASEWSAKWISTKLTGGPRSCAPAPHLRIVFYLPEKPLRARLFITALGLYDFEVNGVPSCDNIFSPGWTDYKRRVQVQTYDVVDSLHAGENVLGVILGDGWYCGHVNNMNRQQYGQRPSLLAQLEIDCTNGEKIKVVTNREWKYASGPILENDLLMGESYDSRLSLGTWSSPGYNDNKWHAVTELIESGIILSVSNSPRVRRKEIFPVSFPLRTSSDSWKRWIFDLGQNIAGRVRFTFNARRGTHFQFRYAEMLDSDNELYVSNLRTARCTDQYTSGGNFNETWEPRFTFHGFRYVEISTMDHSAEIPLIEGIALYSDLERTGQFSCSEPLLDRLFENIEWGMKGNFLEVPTDCPQRDERMGWTGDAQVFISTACFLRDVRGFFHKWSLDVADAQQPSGLIPIVAPHANATGDGGPAWADAVIICPWQIYLNYGDRRILEQNYPVMQRFIEYIRIRCKNNIRSHPDVDAWGGHGDWLACDGGGLEGSTPKDLIGTAFLAHSLYLLSRIASVLGKFSEAESYRRWHQEVVVAFQGRFITGDGLIVGKTQTAYVLALHFHLLPDDLRESVAKDLVKDIERRNWHLSTGFVGTPYLCQVLEENGYLDVAYRLLEQKSLPSWLFPVLQGATTIWERWDGWSPTTGFQSWRMNSFNHYAYGAVGAWMVRSVAGIAIDESKPGGSHIFLRPRPGGSLKWAKAIWNSPRGRVEIHWQLVPTGLHVSFRVPAYATATLLPPQGYSVQQKEFGPGLYTFILSTESQIEDSQPIPSVATDCLLAPMLESS